MSYGILGDSAPQPIVLSVDNAAQIRTRALVAGVVVGAIGAGLYFVLRHHRAFAPPKYQSNARRRTRRASYEPKSWYLFRYERGQGRKLPKEYEGPFARKIFAQTAQRAAVSKPTASGRYVIKELTDRQFTKLWGAPPIY